MFLRKREDGSITLEASLILPFFLCFILALITMIRISTVEIALQNTVSESTKQIAAHMYPIGLMYDRFSETWVGEEFHKRSDDFKKYRDKIILIEQKANEYSKYFPDEIKSIVENLSELRNSFENGAIAAYNSTLIPVFQPVVDHYVDGNILDLRQLYVTKVTLPNLRDRQNAIFGLEVTYNMPLYIPFIDKTLTFKHQAFERVWAGDSATQGNKGPVTQPDSDEANHPESTEDASTEDDIQEDHEEKHAIEFISSPVQRGHKVYILANGPPNRTATIKITYASGYVKEETCRSTNSGKFACNIKIGPNSNPGNFQVLMTVGQQQQIGSFTVLTKDQYDLLLGKRKEASKQKRNK